MACCQRIKTFESSSQYQQHISRKLSEIEKIFPGASFILVINNGHIIYPSHKKKEPALHQELLEACGRLPGFLTNFSQTIGEENCTSVHIRGILYQFSFYYVGDYQLVFYSEISENLEYFKVSADKDERMQQILEDLKLQIDSV